MRYRSHCSPYWLLTFITLLIVAILAGCAAKPVEQAKLNAAVQEHRPESPQPAFSDMDHALSCLGDRLREQTIQPLLIGYSAVADTTGKTGVDFAALMRSALSKVAARGNNISITAMAMGTTGKLEVPSVEERVINRDMQGNPGMLARPDWIISGGSVSVTSAFLSLQKSAGLSARDLDLAASSTSTVDLVSLSFGVKWAESGVDLPIPTVDIRVSYQMLSNASEAGVFAQARLDKRPLAAGLRFGHTVAVSQIPEDAIRAGMSTAVIQILSSRYAVGMVTCPSSDLTPDANLPKAERLPSPQELPKLWAAMSATERITWMQGRLAAAGYAPGEADGKLGPRTRDALVRAAQDLRLPPTGQITDALYYQMATRELAMGRDPRKPVSAQGSIAAAPARIHVQVQQPNAAYIVGVLLRASVVAPQAGFMNCWLVTPDGPMSLFPILAARSNFTTANSPVLLPDNNIVGPHPIVRLTLPGAHELWCGQARINITQRLPAELRPGNLGHGFSSTSALRQAFAKAAGNDWLAEGSALFKVVEPAPR